MARPRSDIRTRILHAARQRFLLEGVDGAPLRRIARDARTSIAMIYYYFPAKDDLFFAIVEEVYEVLLVDLTRALDPALPVEERVRRLYRRVGALSDDERLVVRLVLHEALVSSSRLDRLIERFQRGHVPHVLRTIADGLTDGTFEKNLHPLLVGLTMIALGGPAQLLRRVVEGRLPTMGLPAGEALSDALIGILLRGIGGKTTASQGSGQAAIVGGAP
jgi:TetR/AcrR family transcriptional regulator